MIPLDIQIATAHPRLPSAEDFTRWVAAALPAAQQHWELTIRLVDEAESQELNHTYRHKDKPTNVLSFPSDLPPELNIPLLGDLIMCAPLVESEAREQGKTASAHWAHLTVHGCLHLLGYDHQDDIEAEAMEAMETRILDGLGFADPYADDRE